MTLSPERQLAVDTLMQDFIASVADIMENREQRPEWDDTVTPLALLQLANHNLVCVAEAAQDENFMCQILEQITMNVLKASGNDKFAGIITGKMSEE